MYHTDFFFLLKKANTETFFVLLHTNIFVKLSQNAWQLAYIEQ